ncbi:ER membrane protein complex subunit 1-like [Apostichopus japonicus]|uniref:ER membrane protein complex subunit 1-like n=1 Tax=Stichopus japonicus TaxID=307972 RepID=UPI003AB61128
MVAFFAGTLIFLLQIFNNLTPSGALYEDQVGKFDWRQQYIGHVKEAVLEYGGARKHIFVSSDSNVLAAILARNGNIAWRHIFPHGEAGIINALLYTGQELLTVSNNGFVVRSWDPNSGSLQWEAITSSVLSSESGENVPGVMLFQEEGNPKKPRLAVTYNGNVIVLNVKSGEELWKESLPNSDSIQDYLIQVNLNDEDDGALVVLGRVPGMGFKVFRYNAKDGTLLGQTQVPSPWLQEDTSCMVLSGDKVVCADSQSKAVRIATIQSRQQDQTGFSSIPLTTLQLPATGFHVEPINKYSVGDHRYFALGLDDRTLAWLKLEGEDIRVVKTFPQVSSFTFDYYKDQQILTIVSGRNEEMLIQSHTKDKEITNLRSKAKIGASSGSPKKVYAMYLDRKDKTVGSRTLLQTSDHGLHLVQQGGDISWSREESLASAVSVEMVDLPVSETEAQFEDEFGTRKGDNIFSMFARRTSTQFAQLQTYFDHLRKKVEAFQKGSSHHDHNVEQLTYAVRFDDTDEIIGEYLTRDEFSLHKIIIVATRAGKVFGLDSEDGCILWSHFLPNVEPITRGGKQLLPLMIQRTTAHFPNPPQCTIIAKSKTSDRHVIFSFNPINGKPSLPEHPQGQELPFTLKQATMQNIVDQEFMKVILLVDTEYKVYAYPANSESVVRENADNIYLFTADSDSGALNGYRLGAADDTPASHNSFRPIRTAEEIWHVQLPSLLQTITHVVAKRPAEEVHSQGRVLGDRTVLYKYLNPNLVVVVSEGEDAIAKSHVTVYLIDVVTGNIVFQTDHKRVEGPVHVVHSENWVVYHFWNNRYRRNEVTVLELFEGSSQKNSTAFSSLDPPSDPLVERQSYIFSESLQALSTTQTEKGITAKHVLMVLKSGGIISLPKRFLDPRRPLVPTQMHKEEGLIPYIPELIAPPTAYINYNQSVFGIENVHTSPAGLESTCLVLAYGLDFYFTRATPSNLFDVLKEDFDYLLIGTVLTALLVAAVVTRRLASMKALRQAWK